MLLGQPLSSGCCLSLPLLRSMRTSGIHTRHLQVFSVTMQSGKNFFVANGPAADATDAPQPWGLLCNPVIKIISFFFTFTCNGAPVEWNWQGKTEVLGEKTCPSATLSTTNLTWNYRGMNRGLCGEKPATNRLSYGTALFKAENWEANIACGISTTDFWIFLSHQKHVPFQYRKMERIPRCNFPYWNNPSPVTEFKHLLSLN
jgi:hypothetical protein